MICSCGNINAYRLRKRAGESNFSCDACGGVSTPASYDVYFDGKINPNLTDTMGRPMEFISKGHKARYMKERGIMEVGDRVHGAPFSVAEQRFERPRVARTDIEKAVRNAVETVRRKYR